MGKQVSTRLGKMKRRGGGRREEGEGMRKERGRSGADRHQKP